MQRQEMRILVAMLAVGIWMAAGWIFHLSPNAYLVVGIPYVFLFQHFVARRPLAELWLRAPSPRGLPFWVLPVAAAFMALPLRFLAMRWDLAGWPVRCWMMGAALGALPLGWAIFNLRAPALRCLALCFATAGVWGVVAFSGFSAWHHHGVHFHDHAWAGFGSSLALYLPVSFVMEEVFFRGALDSFVQRPGDRDYWLTAAFISVLWGWWHLPITGIKTLPQLAFLAVFFPLFHLPFGVLFSHYWRRSGNLLVPASVHAFIDAFRNVVV